jgi:Domain of Unknown Function (DUF1080)
VARENRTFPKLRELTRVAHRGAALLLMILIMANSAMGAAGRGPSEEPKVINPGPPPSDAIVLFDGTDLSKWKSAKDGGPARWEVKDGVLTVTKTGSIVTAQPFGDCQLHIEWATPAEVKGEGQGRGNSGVIFMGLYELQVLDSYQNKTYYDGQAGAIYNQYPPLVNASRKPGEWQVYDVIFHAPRFDEQGKQLRAGTFTVLQNGVLVQDHVQILGPTSQRNPKMAPHGPKLPLLLQDHHNPVRYRNIWLREL